MTEVSSLLRAPSAPRVPAQAAGRLGVCGAVRRPRSRLPGPHRGDSPIDRDLPLAAPTDSPHLEDFAALAPDQENDIP